MGEKIKMCEQKHIANNRLSCYKYCRTKVLEEIANSNRSENVPERERVMLLEAQGARQAARWLDSEPLPERLKARVA
jgi:hypothetical protein